VLALSGTIHSYMEGICRSTMRLFILQPTLGRLIAATDAPPSTAINLYNSRAVSTFSLLTQLYQPLGFTPSRNFPQEAGLLP